MKIVENNLFYKDNEYTTEEIDDMREHLAESEWEGMRSKDLKQVLWNGCLGWSKMSDEDIIDYYEDCFS